MGDINGRTIEELKEIIKVCRDNRISKIKLGETEIEFSALAFAAEMSDSQIEDQVSKFRKVATDVEKEFERTLYHSAV